VRSIFPVMCYIVMEGMGMLPLPSLPTSEVTYIHTGYTTLHYATQATLRHERLRFSTVYVDTIPDLVFDSVRVVRCTRRVWGSLVTSLAMSRLPTYYLVPRCLHSK
jgi:hypothetical protein